MNTKAVKHNPIKPKDVSRVQSAEAKKTGGKMTKESHVPRMQRAAIENCGKPGGK